MRQMECRKAQCIRTCRAWFSKSIIVLKGKGRGCALRVESSGIGRFTGRLGDDSADIETTSAIQLSLHRCKFTELNHDDMESKPTSVVEHYQSPAHKLNGRAYHDDWLHNLLEFGFDGQLPAMITESIRINETYDVRRVKCLSKKVML